MKKTIQELNIGWCIQTEITFFHQMWNDFQATAKFLTVISLTPEKMYSRLKQSKFVFYYSELEFFFGITSQSDNISMSQESFVSRRLEPKDHHLWRKWAFRINHQHTFIVANSFWTNWPYTSQVLGGLIIA